MHVVHLKQQYRPQYIYKVIGKNIKYYRKQKNWTQEQLAFYCHLSYGYIKNLEAEHVDTSISIETLNFIANTLDTDITNLLSSEKEKISNP